MLDYMNYLEFIDQIDGYAKGEVAASCISSLFRFLEVNGVDLRSIPKMNYSIALRRGLPFTYFDEESYRHYLFSGLAEGFRKNGKFNENEFSEISSMALIISLGGKSIEPIQRKSAKTYDFDVDWFGDIIEVEVTRPGEKDAWARRLAQAEDLSDYANKLNRSFNINIYIPGLLSSRP